MTKDAAVAVRRIDVDLGVCRGMRFDRGADAWVILLPGANYSTTAPLLWFAREVEDRLPQLLAWALEGGG